MGELLSLADHRRRRERTGAFGTRLPRTTFYFDLADPGTYFAAERVERLFPGVRWAPASLPAAQPGSRWSIEEAEARASALGVPLVWPDDHPSPRRAAMRAAVHAASCGRGSEFVLAAARLTFCGGFDLDDPEVLAEAAAAAGLGLDACLRAARDESLDRQIQAATRTLVEARVQRLPAVQVGRHLFGGEERLGEAAAARRAAMAPAKHASSQ